MMAEVAVGGDGHKEHAAHLGIPGLDKVCDSRYCFLGKIIWVIILVTCTGILTVQAVNRIQYYMSEPVSISISYLNNGSLLHPDVTVCHNDFWDQVAYVEVQKEIANLTGLPITSVTTSVILKYMTYMELYMRVAFPLSEMLSMCMIENKDCLDVGQWTPLISVLGMCYTYSLNHPINVTGSLYGLTLLLHTRPNKSDSWKVLIHDARNTPKANLYTQGISIARNTAVDVHMHLKQFNFLSTPIRQCSGTNSDLCYVNCLSEIILTRLSCRMPFMEKVAVPYCSATKVIMANNLIGDLILNKAELGCTCLPDCHTNEFGYNVDTINLPPFSSAVSYTRLRIYYEDFRHQVVVEDFAYGLVPLLSDLGGSIGLFLGFSLLTIVELGESLCVTIRKRYGIKLHAVTTTTTGGAVCKDGAVPPGGVIAD